MAKKKGGRKGGGAQPKVQAPSAKNVDEVEKPTPEAEASASKDEANASATSEPAASKSAKAKATRDAKTDPPAARDSSDEDAPDEEDEEDAPDGADDPKPAPASSASPTHGAAWATPFVKIERAWTWFEMRLLLFVILALVSAMVAWISLKGLSVPVESESSAGMMFRVLFGGIVAGAISHQVQKRAKLAELSGRILVVGAMVAGGAIAPLWRGVAVDYFGRMLNWLQEGSSLTMFGGLRGVSTRLTIILAMIGASLAAASGKHISIDALLRFLTPKLRVLTFVLSTVATITVCVTAAWGFTDYISIESFGADKDLSRGEKISHVQKHVSQDLFLWRKQVVLDLQALPRVVGGGRWDDEKRMNGRQWNEFLESGGYRDYFAGEKVDAMKAPDDDLDSSRIPMIVVPDGTPRGLLTHVLNLAFPIGLLVIAFRLFLRLILVVSGHESVEVEGDLVALKAEGPAIDAEGDPEPGGEPVASAPEPEPEPHDDAPPKKSTDDEEEVG